MQTHTQTHITWQENTSVVTSSFVSETFPRHCWPVVRRLMHQFVYPLLPSLYFLTTYWCRKRSLEEQSIFCDINLGCNDCLLFFCLVGILCVPAWRMRWTPMLTDMHFWQKLHLHLFHALSLLWLNVLNKYWEEWFFELKKYFGIK